MDKSKLPENPLLLTGQQRGLIVSNPIKISNQSIHVVRPSIDERELRFALLYWDKLACLQSNAIDFFISPEIEFLRECGILIQAELPSSGSWDQADLLRQEFLGLFHFCETISPGAWAIAQGDKSLVIDSPYFSGGRGVLVELLRAIPTPDKEMPLQEILEFKEKRADELANLRLKLDELYLRIGNADDSFFEFGRVAREIDSACSALLKAVKDSRFPFKLADVNVTYDPSVGKIIVPAFSVGTFAGFTEPLFNVGAAIGAAMITSLKCELKLRPARGIALSNRRASPYNFVVSYHDHFL